MLRNLLLYVLFSVFVSTGATTSLFSMDTLKNNLFDIYNNTALQTRYILDHPVTSDMVTYYAFTKNNSKNYIKLNTENMHTLVEQKIVFVIHGWTGSRESDWYADLKDAFLAAHGEYVVVQVDWKKPAAPNYYVASINTYDIAKFISKLILNLNTNFKVKLDDVLLIGHSLGGQITGLIGKYIQGKAGRKLPRIIALDPAGPLFIQRPDNERLNRNDADIVQVIHTNGGEFGFLEPCGTIDFFPNGGRRQPGCRRIDLDDLMDTESPMSCDHARAYEYLIEAIENPKSFVAKKCGCWAAFKKNNCDGETVTLANITTKARGKFYFVTNKDRPYGQLPKYTDTEMSQSGFAGVLDKIKNMIYNVINRMYSCFRKTILR